MSGHESHESARFQQEEIRFLLDQQAQRTKHKDELSAPRTPYMVELSGQAIPLEYLEFEILKFLSRRPYKAFTRRQIADAVSTADHPVDHHGLDVHIMSLRDKLGLFSDYVQSVPYVGYRFKA